MSNLLTHEEYQAIAADLNPPSMSFIDGRFRPALSGKTLPTINPATGEVLAKIAACDKEDVDSAVEKAREAFEDGRWSRRHPDDRKSVLIKLCKLISQNSRELAVLESLDSGKPILDCETIDIPELIHTIKWHAEAIDKIYDQTAPVGPNAVSMIVREPIGVVGAVLPWNFPLLMLAWKIAPALAAGCSMVVKPAEQTSLTALKIAELAMEAGLPRGVLNIVTGTGAEVGEPLGLHMDVDMVSFTGSTLTGRRFLRYAADSNLKKVVLECGGKNPCVVLEDAEDLDLVAAQVVNAAFWNMGENCSAGSRLIVHEKVKDELLERIKNHARDWRTGDPLNPANHLGALIDKNHFNKVSGYLDLGKEENKTVLLGGETMDGVYVQPTVFDGVHRDDRLAQEEIFGPVLSVITVSSYEDAIRVANDTDYGLAASVFTANGKRAIRAAQSIRAGTVTINCFGEGDITTPFGGYKQSGFGGRDNSIHAHDQYTELKTIWIDLGDSADEIYVS
ncbi:aldehyde dehydrogenase [Motiliproteus sp. MSK22-1]|uniref:aldehyde dehydrogenase n=1 Tax=Motiliproteus sp. MSK22-1 TaxID=1897630 RepID=UPI0009767884|nr:aldehyde dehydrogenase [Motiliproteus sp. MSK22-1]OMH36269.1 aldehyde dehydrogenase [Motiliproteus sp. MSK22-1]